jgi:DNA-binding CsgD family transcriptional regulator
VWLVAAFLLGTIARDALDGPAPACGRPAGHLEAPTHGEIRVLYYLPTNLSAREIAGELYLSVNTVKTHQRHLYRKLGARSRTQAVEQARALGLLAPSSRRHSPAPPRDPGTDQLACLHRSFAPADRWRPCMSDPYEPPRPRDDALESELESLHQQEEEGHATPKEQRRAEQLERRLQVDEHGEELHDRRQADRERDREDDEERHRQRHH